MNRETDLEFVKRSMLDYAKGTSLDPPGEHPERYLWTDAFAVCNYLGLFQKTKNDKYLSLALALADQVHHVLGRHRDDDPRKGWISGLSGHEGELHPTAGGLRIGKEMNERRPSDSFDEHLEWDRDGQYYHYLTKWMHALNRISRVTEDPRYIRWAIELAETAHGKFIYLPSPGSRKRMFWKMSIDLSCPLVSSMGQHDPLDGYITYRELMATANRDFPGCPLPDLAPQITDMARICNSVVQVTEDPLGIGGLLADAARLVQLSIKCAIGQEKLLNNVLDSAIRGLVNFSEENTLKFPAGYRLAFRELGLSIGLKGVHRIAVWIEKHPDLFEGNNPLHSMIEDLKGYIPAGDAIDRFWLDERNRAGTTWTEHQGINMVMLATSLAPEGFLTI